MFFIVKRGLQCSYETVQSNEMVFKGKMLFSNQIRNNFAHKERCFIEYDEFNVNRVENKILKSTLLYLYKMTTSLKNKNDIKTLLNSFVDVDFSVNYELDFSKIRPERNTKDYEIALAWSKIFLRGKSFTSFSGSQIAFALLFPMETLFESFVAAHMRKLLKGTGYSLSSQDRACHLFDEPNKKFLMRPDLVIKEKQQGITFIMDTKWKVLSDVKNHYGISQTDMYQMYAYQKKYLAKNVTLLYPYTEKMAMDKKIEFISKDGAVVKVKFVDVLNIKKSLSKIISDIDT